MDDVPFDPPFDWAAAERRFGEIVALAEDAVREWAWASKGAGWHHLEPLWAERHLGRPVRRHRTKGPDADGGVEVGLDGTGYLVIARWHDVQDPANSPTMLVTRTPYAGYEHVQMRWTRERIGWRLDGLVVPLHEDGCLTALSTWSCHPADPGPTARHETYVYDGDRLREIRTRELGPAAKLGDARPQRTSLIEVQYASSGALEALLLRKEGAGEPQVLYRRASPLPMKRARTALVDALALGVIEWLARSALREPITAFAMAYDAESPRPLPPLLALCTGDANARGWNPAEFDVVDSEPPELSTDAILSLCHRLQEDWEDRGLAEGPRDVLREVAKRVAATDVPTQIRSAEGAVIVVTDVETEDVCDVGEDVTAHPAFVRISRHVRKPPQDPGRPR